MKFKCLVLDHDDTVVRSETTVGYPYFCDILQAFRPGETISLTDYVLGCYDLGFVGMCRQFWQFTDEELKEEYLGWKEYVRTHIPDAYPGMKEIILRQKRDGGLVCVVSHSCEENISRDYLAHFGVLPDRIYGYDLPEHLRKPSPYPLLDLMEHYGLKPEEVLVVDDLKLGWSMAKAAGVRIGFAAWEKIQFPRIAKEMQQLCDYSFLSTKELENFLFE